MIGLSMIGRNPKRTGALLNQTIDELTAELKRAQGLNQELQDEVTVLRRRCEDLGYALDLAIVELMKRR